MRGFRYPSVSSDNDLSRWIGTQKQANKGNGAYRMTPCKFNSIVMLPNWEWDVLSSRWNKMFNETETYINEYGKLPPKRSQIEIERRIRSWIENQKCAKKKGKLSQNRIQKLETLPIWNWEIDFEEKWNKMFFDFKKYIEKVGRFPKYKALSNEERKFWIWICRQRFTKRYRKLSNKRISQLESLSGWKWDVFNEKWDDKFEELKSWILKYNRYPSKHSKQLIEKAIGSWVSHQKQTKKGKGKGVITFEQIAKLESVSGWKWEGRFGKTK